MIQTAIIAVLASLGAILVYIWLRFEWQFAVGAVLALFVTGTTINIVALIGVIMLVTPGPALVVIPVGLAILSIEFAWARSWLRRLRETISNRNSNSRSARARNHRDRVAPD